MTKDDFKSLFANGKIPDGNDFANLIDFMVDENEASEKFVTPQQLNDYLPKMGNESIVKLIVYNVDIIPPGIYKMQLTDDYKTPLVQCYQKLTDGTLRATNNYSLEIRNNQLYFDFTALALRDGDALQIVVR